jgi:hypothetical protein
MNNHSAGFIIVRRPEWLHAHRGERSAAASHPPHYRGVDREPLSVRALPDIARNVRCRIPTESAAILAMVACKERASIPSLCYELDDIRDIYTLLSNPHDWEILSVMGPYSDWANIPAQTELLGYDVASFPWMMGSKLTKDSVRNEYGLLGSIDEANAIISAHEGHSAAPLAITDLFYQFLLAPPRYVITEIDDENINNWIPGYTHELRLLSVTPTTTVLASIHAFLHYTGMTRNEGMQLLATLPKRVRFTHIGSISGFERALSDAGVRFESWVMRNVDEAAQELYNIMS